MKWEFRQSAVNAFFGGRELRGNNGFTSVPPPRSLRRNSKERLVAGRHDADSEQLVVECWALPHETFFPCDSIPGAAAANSAYPMGLPLSGLWTLAPILAAEPRELGLHGAPVDLRHHLHPIPGYLTMAAVCGNCVQLDIITGTNEHNRHIEYLVGNNAREEEE